MFLESRKRAATTIQSHVRGWVARQSAIRKKKSITIIQVMTNIQPYDFLHECTSFFWVDKQKRFKFLLHMILQFLQELLYNGAFSFT